MDQVYHVIFRPEPEGGFTVIVPSLPGCVTYGKSLIEAHRMVEEAIDLYIKSLKKHGEEIPTDEAAYVTTVRMPSSKHRLKAHA